MNISVMGYMRNAYITLARKPDEKRPLGRPTRRWEGNIGMDLRRIGGGLWIGLTWFVIGTVTGSCENDDETAEPIRGGEFLDHLKHTQLLRKDCVFREIFYLAV
jgi:hypothetical protein